MSATQIADALRRRTAAAMAKVAGVSDG
jgi:hypothetical protein